MNRYLLNISYIGTHFSGIQRQIPVQSTIQGAIEHAIQQFKPINTIKLILSSRTDAGVHAIQSTVHVDIQRANGDVLPCEAITIKLNKFFANRDIAIRIINTEHVPDTFHARYHVKSRTYLYRFAVLKKDIVKFQDILSKDKIQKDKLDGLDLNRYTGTMFYPIEELHRCFFIPSEFNLEESIKAAKLFIGYHDFRTFMNVSSQNRDRLVTYTLRNIDDCFIVPGNPLTTSYNRDKSLDIYDYFEIHVKSRSFLYRQVRRMAAAIIAVGSNRVSVKDIYEMLTIPSINTWPNKINVLPPFGLYLCKVEYNEIDKQFPK